KRLRFLGIAYYRRGDTAKGDIQLAAIEQRLTDQKAAQDKAVADAEKKATDENKDEKAVEKAKADAKKSLEQKIKSLTSAMDELKGHKAVAALAYKGGHELLKKAGGVDPDYLAWVQYQAGETDKAL